MSIDAKQLLKDWETVTGDPVLEPDAISVIRILETKAFGDYEPCQFDPFEARFARWLNNVDSDDDRKVMLSLLSHVFYVGRREFEALYREAFNNQILRWILTHAKLDISSPQVEDQLTSELPNTWFCPLTDSLRINGFLKVNELIGHSFRPDWRSLVKFGDFAKVSDYCAKSGITRVVLIEDFVGSGNQSAVTVAKAAEALPGLEFLLVPMIVCPCGHKTFRQLAAKTNNLEYHPALELARSNFLYEQPVAGEPACFAAARILFAKIAPKLGLNYSSMFGYENTGALVVMYSNCPDNSLPVFSEERSTWSALFPRIVRG